MTYDSYPVEKPTGQPSGRGIVRQGPSWESLIWLKVSAWLVKLDQWTNVTSAWRKTSWCGWFGGKGKKNVTWGLNIGMGVSGCLYLSQSQRDSWKSFDSFSSFFCFFVRLDEKYLSRESRIEPLTQDALGFRRNKWKVLKGKVRTEAPSHSAVCES